MAWLQILKPAPVLNTSNFKRVFSAQIPLNDKGHPYHYEFVALPGMHFPIVQRMGDSIFEIQWPAYGKVRLYTDARFGNVVETPNVLKSEKLLRAKDFLQHMEQHIGVSYIWGGNWAAGIPEMLDYYPPSQPISPRMQELWAFRGLDCSGLLFAASQGATPRNTSALIRFGNPVKMNDLRPMDMIVYPGHVLFVRDGTTTIESRATIGSVYVCSLAERLGELLQERQFAEEWVPGMDPARHFVIRRFAL